MKNYRFEFVKVIKNSTKFKKAQRYVKRFIAKNLLNNKSFLPNNIVRIYHYHIRKSGGTSINTVFWEQAGFSGLGQVKKEPILIGKGKSIVRIDKKLIENGHYFYASSHFPMWEIKLKPNTYTFTVLREPYERLVSLYKYYQWVYQVSPEEGRLLDPSYDYLIKQKYLQNISFNIFLNRLSKKYLFGQLYFFSRELNIREALNNIKKVDRVFFKDSYDRIVPHLNNDLKLNLSFSTKKSRRFKNVKFSISDNEEKLAKSILIKEMKFYELAKNLYD